MADAAATDLNIEREKKKRPATLSILVILLFVRALLTDVLAFFLVLAVLGSGEVQSTIELLSFSLVLATLILSILMLIALWGLWTLKPWAWQMNMILMGFFLIGGIWLHFTQSDNRLINDLGLALNIVTVFYLIQGEVRHLFISDRGASSSS
ncbi:MAG: hypothetical protein ACK2UJ_09725 [Candidatus Promineifilaceae bacterium]